MTVEMNSELKNSATADNVLFTLTKEQIAILDREDELHLAGKTKSYSWKEAKEIIRGKKEMFSGS